MRFENISFSFKANIRLEIICFHSPQASDGARAVGFYRHGLGLRQF